MQRTILILTIIIFYALKSYPNYPNEKFLKIKEGYNVAYEDFGTNIKGTILFLHGLANTYSVWRYHAESFSNEYRVVMYDLKGHGESSVYDTNFSFPNMIFELKTVMKELNIQNPYIVGHSYGGTIVLHYLAKYPKAFKDIILFDPAIPTLGTNFYYNAATRVFSKTSEEMLSKRLGGRLKKYKSNMDKYYYEFLNLSDRVKTNKKGLYTFRTDKYVFQKVIDKVALFDYANFPYINREIYIVIFRMGFIISKLFVLDVLDKIRKPVIHYMWYAHSPIVTAKEEINEVLKKRISQKE